jgi:Mlc titration factor MtfA (ptsG expression regulator)
MQFRPLSSILLFFAILLLAGFIALYYTQGGYWYIGIIVFAIVVFALNIYKIPIDRSGFKNKEVKIDQKLTNVLIIEYPILKTYSDEKIKNFRKRMFQFMYGRESYLVTGETEKLDLYHTVLIAAPAVIMSMETKFDRADDVERFVAYQHPFPSPKMKFLHTAEFDEEDGVLIVSLEQLMLSLKKPEVYYHIVFHIWSERLLLKKENFPAVPPSFINKLYDVFGFNVSAIEKVLGYPSPDLRVVALTAFFTRQPELNTVFPQFFKEINNYIIQSDIT